MHTKNGATGNDLHRGNITAIHVGREAHTAFRSSDHTHLGRALDKDHHDAAGNRVGHLGAIIQHAHPVVHLQLTPPIHTVETLGYLSVAWRVTYHSPAVCIWKGAVGRLMSNGLENEK